MEAVPEVLAPKKVKTPVVALMAEKVPPVPPVEGALRA
jgi:hypothetical protein